MELPPAERFRSEPARIAALSPGRTRRADGPTRSKRHAPMCNFVDLSGGFTEWYLLGNLASLFPNQTLEYDPLAGRIVNNEAADQAARPAYREGWKL